MKKGLIIVNTGNGKGKTTAALGQAFRALGHGLPVCVVQFIKGSWTYGELASKDRFKDLLDFHVMGRGFTFQSDDLEKDKEIARKGWAVACDAMASEKYFMVILDELTYLFQYGFLDMGEALDSILHRPEKLHVVITGRNAPPALLQAADMVTVMEAVKHPLKAGVKAQRGIEF